MIKLIINGNEIELDSDFTNSVTRENPLITRAGDYSYDIDINLLNPHNRKAYKEFHRLNTDEVLTNRNFVLLNDEKVLARGKEVILSIDSRKAKIQLLSNNSELNFVCDNSKSIRELNFGSVTSMTPEYAAKVSRGLYGEMVNGILVKEAYPQVFKQDFEDYGTGAELFNALGEDATGISFSDAANLRPQPYLLYYIDKLVEILGYRMGECDIDREKYKRLIVVNGYDTKEYAKMLPNWTVSEFITEVEKFFNVVFYVDSVNNRLDILSVDNFYQKVGCAYIEKDCVLDEHDVDFDNEDDSLQTSYQNVGYKTPDSEYWRFASIDEKVYALCEKTRKDFNYNETYNQTDFQIFYSPRWDVEWIHYENSDESSTYGRLVNQFAPVVKEDSTSRTELKILPAKVLCSYRTGAHGGYMFTAPIPVYYENKGTTLSRAIREGTEDNAGNILQVAFYLGFCHFRDIGGSRNASSYGSTMCMTTFWQQMFNVVWAFTSADVPEMSGMMTLSLNGKNGRCSTELKNCTFIDTSRLFKIKFISKEWIDPRTKFVICNRLFYCKKLEYKMKNDGLSYIVEGEFYPSATAISSDSQEPGTEDDVTENAAQTEYSNIEAESIEGLLDWQPRSASLDGNGFYSYNNGYNSFAKDAHLNAGFTALILKGEIGSSETGWEMLQSARVIKYVDEAKTWEKSAEIEGNTIISVDNISVIDLIVGTTYSYILIGSRGNNRYKTLIKFVVI